MRAGLRALSLASAVLMLLGARAAAGYGQSADDTGDAPKTVTVEGVGGLSVPGGGPCPEQHQRRRGQGKRP